MDFTSFTNADLLPGFIWFAIVFIFVCLSEIILNAANMFLQKAFLYRKARKVLSGYSDTDIKLFIDYVFDGVSYLEGRHD